jgi:hypothetical protein
MKEKQEGNQLPLRLKKTRITYKVSSNKENKRVEQQSTGRLVTEQENTTQSTKQQQQQQQQQHE